ncbi:hypothetical protein U1769_08990 [Sphingomonas sp. ZT3P38]
MAGLLGRRARRLNHFWTVSNLDPSHAQIGCIPLIVADRAPRRWRD